jgi:hypothetical protein
LFQAGLPPTAANESETLTDEFRYSRQPPDRAIDDALRSVPLPQGLLTRLGLIAYSIPEDAADQVDWLGC